MDPLAESLVAAGGWADPRGVDFVSFISLPKDPIVLKPTAPATIIARVVDDAGRPLGCRADLSVADPDAEWAAKVVPGSALSSTCLGDGEIRLGPLRPAAFDVDLLPSNSLPVRLHGAVTKAGEQRDLGTVRADPGAALAVLVEDTVHAPLKNASVVASNRSGVIVTAKARTDSGGVALLKGLQSGTPVDITVDADGFVTNRAHGVEPARDRVVVTLRQGRQIRGRVQTPDGDPVRAKVAATSVRTREVVRAESGDDGRFVIDGVPAGVFTVQGAATGYGDSDPETIDLTEGGRADEVDLRLRDLRSLHGLVLDADHRPVSGALVIALEGGAVADPPSSTPGSQSYTGFDGSFVLSLPSSTPAEVVAMAPGYSAASVTRPGEGGPIELVLGRAASLAAKCPAGLGFDNRLFIVEASGLARWVGVRGRREVRVDDLEPGDAVVALASGARRAARLIAGDTVSVDLGSAAEVGGRVTRDGRGAPRAAVMLADVAPGHVGQGPSVIADDAGSFLFNTVSPGDYLLVAESAEGRGERRISVAADDQTDIDLPLSAARVRVVTSDEKSGASISGAIVIATPHGASCRAYSGAGAHGETVGWSLAVSDGGCARATTGDDGTAMLTLSQTGRHELELTASGYESATVTIDAVDGTTEVPVKLERGGAPIVRVLIETTPPGISGSLYCVQGDGSSSRNPVSGEAVCESLHPGPAEVAFRADGFGFGRAKIDVPEHGEAEVTIRVPRGGDLVVPIDAASSGPIRVVDEGGTQWNLPYGLGWPICGVETQGESGSSYVCHDLPPGRYVLEAGGRRRSVDVASGKSTVAY